MSLSECQAHAFLGRVEPRLQKMDVTNINLQSNLGLDQTTWSKPNLQPLQLAKLYTPT
jgi:hypothetical protein